MEAQIKEEFNKSGFIIADEDAVLNKCLTFCNVYNLTPSDLVSSWELYYLNRQLNESTVHNDEMDGFVLHLQNEQKEAIIKEEPGLHAYSIRDVDMILNDEPEDSKETILDTPTARPLARYEELGNSGHGTNGSLLSSSKQSSILTPFGQRTNKFVVQFETKNEPIAESGNRKSEDEDMGDEIIRRAQPKNRCSLVIHGSKPEPGCRFMYDRIEDRFNFLVNRIKKHTSTFLASGQYEEPADPTIAFQKSIFAVGMICCDGEGHLNEKSVLLQSSVEHSGGEHVRLELEKLNKYSIFPGQVVGVVGTNPSGHCLVASKIVDAIPTLPSSDSNLHPAKKLALNEEGLSNCQTLAELSVIVAAGPFTTTDNLLFEPLKELLAYATRKPPQLLILLGPFVDSEHPEIQKATCDRSFDEVFYQEIIRRLRDHVEYMGSSSRVLLVPSIRDANHDHVFPQPPFDLNPDMKDQITSLTNPGIFDANEVKVGCCSVDVIKHLSGEEISKNLTDRSSGARLSRLATHIISQRSFYPLYPPAESVPLDFSIAPEALDISSIPNLLILPSDLTPFLKVLSLNNSEEQEHVNCLCVNPGRLAKGIGGGTFVELYYHGSPETAYGSIIRI